ncbi:transglutaminase family protein [Rhodobacter sp. 24-YEA-8]|uniref:transglutaminase family protein n=1 Tax=Rhodobacter sp. 24-YEA-8 TaxID=1884310 RepID=UPI0008941F06|nr:transglutaminase family protein [Rhodobacter sp. 24-YEA-8]SEB72699.1 Transglutaminase-like enzyme, putative cysteine protease [Rhodobacter sp. 24-YEA-8]
MRLSVNHITRYSYDRPVRGLVQSHRLTPSVFQGQKVISWEISVEAGDAAAVRGAEFTDGAGDRIQGWSIAGPLTEVAVTVRGTVETTDTAGMLKGCREVINPCAYKRGTALTAGSVALSDLAESVSDAGGALALAHGLSAAVTGAIAYHPGVTDAHSSASEALALGEGVCQDHAHALIALARLRDLPARYVSGYLFADASGAAHEAAHAWAEIHVPGLGWIGFDPANACCPDERYIRLASGFDARDAAPIRGVARGGQAGEEAMDVTVAVLSSGQ